MSGGSQHNPNGRQSQLGSGWSPLQLQVANLLARAPQAHMASDRGVTWHTPTPPPHLYHVPAPSPPDPLQAMKAAGGNALYRHTGTPPDIYHRHTPTPPDKHHMRHTPSPGDIKASAALPPVDLYQHLGPGRDKLVRPEELLAYARVGVDLSLSGGRAANGAPPNVPVSTSAPATPPIAPALSVRDAPALSVRDAPTINSLIARAQPRLPHARVDALLERLAPSPVSPHSVIVHSRVAPTPSPPSSNEDSADSCGAPPGSKRKRKPERTLRVAMPPAPVAPPSLPVAPPPEATPPVPAPPTPEAEARVSPPPVQAVQPPAPLENGDATHVKVNGPCDRSSSPAQSHARRKTRSGSAETLADIAAMVAAPAAPEPPLLPPPAVSVDKLRSVLAGPTEPTDPTPSPPPRVPTPPTEPPPAAPASPPSEPTIAAPVPPGPQSPVAEVAAGVALAPRRRSARAPLAEAANVPVESPSEAVPAEPEASAARTAEPAAASFVEVENQLEKMFAGIEEEPRSSPTASRQGDTSVPNEESGPPANRKRRRSAPPHRRSKGPPDSRKKPMRKKIDVRKGRKGPKDGQKDAYDSGSNASSSRSRGPYIQIRGPRDSPLSVSVMNNTGGDDEDCGVRRKGEEFRPRGLHASTLGLRYDATTPDATWLCAFCRLGPHAEGLGDLFGPYALHTDCDEYRALDEATRRRYSCEGADEVWFHEACGVWAPGLVAAGARVWGLAGAVWGARGARCLHCHRAGAALACAKRACRARAHLPCAVKVWTLHHEEFRALCPHHAPT